MVKRTKEEAEKEEEYSDIDVSSSEEEELELQEEGAEEDDNEEINVDFDFFDLNPEVDFHATKNFLRQLLQDDSTLFPLSEMTDFILSENRIGTTIKTDGKESDPYSLIFVLNFTKELTKPFMKKLADYLLERTSKNSEYNLLLRQLLNPKSKFKTGLIISERLINMPVETAPPMYRMLCEEMHNSEIHKDEYDFDYYLVLSRVYKMVSSTIDAEMENEAEVEAGRVKKSKSTKSKYTEPETDYYHYEDEILEKNSMHYAYFDYTIKRQDTDARRVFNDYGIDPQLSLILLDKKALTKSTNEMAEAFPY